MPPVALKGQVGACGASVFALSRYRAASRLPYPSVGYLRPASTRLYVRNHLGKHQGAVTALQAPLQSVSKPCNAWRC